MTMLYLFQIGPVQSFIAAARRTQDLYVGSRLLSMIAEAGINPAQSLGAEMIFPLKASKSTPHRFAFLSDEPEIAPQIEAALRDQWWGIAAQVRNFLSKIDARDTWQDVFDKQVEYWLEIYWVAVPYEPGKHSSSYQQALSAMAARKRLRHFPQVYEEGRKCTLTGAQAALPLDWQRARREFGEAVLRDNEMLGAWATIKRFAQSAEVAISEDFERFPSTEEISGRDGRQDRAYYLAVLHMDGDRMGERLSRLTSLEEHQWFSQQLADFAEQDVPAIIDRYAPGVLVYAGGDDVLALLPTWAALPCANAIQQRFREKTGAEMSAGIAIAHDKFPLDMALEEARLAEKRAKHEYHRNAIVVRQHTGQIREAGAKWPMLSLMETMQLCFQEELIASKLGYDLLDLAHELQDDKILQPAIFAEFNRVLKRRIQEHVSKTDKQQILDLAPEFAAQARMEGNSWESVAHWTILARFLAKGAEA